ncbi:MAG TPA: hypothetical protein VMV59_07035 [Candidatus Dormibacteraeota bacterium]|nr:hypothetical protein [Candidatus Dormibacteraeota bacterium]
MARIQKQNRGTSSADLAERSPGYTANGESQFSRNAAHGGNSEAKEASLGNNTWSRLDCLIAHNMKEVARQERQVLNATTATDLNTATARLEKTRTLLGRLRAEQRGLVS